MCEVAYLPKARGRRYFKLIGGVITLILVAVLLDSLILEPYAIFLSTTTLNVHDPRVPSNKSIKLLHLTDLHISTYGFREMRVIQLVKSLRPDVIVMTGDYVSSKEGLLGLREFLSNLRSVVGATPIVSILGNWDYWSSVPDEVIRLLKEYGVYVLNDRYMILSIGDVKVTFVGFNSFTGTYTLPNFTVLKEAPSRYPIVVLLHEPALSKYVIKYRGDVTLILAGHCHGGQVKLFGEALFLPEGCEGCYEGACKVGNTVMYVSRGIGTSILPVRFTSPPEIVIAYLTSPK